MLEVSDALQAKHRKQPLQKWMAHRRPAASSGRHAWVDIRVAIKVDLSVWGT
jgi:hypothetical protein